MGRSPCCEKPHTNKGTWTKEEDQRLVAYIQAHGHGSWRTLPKAAGLQRCGKSCRLRWINYLRPGLKRGNFTKEEEDTIIELHKLHGNKWSMIAGRLGRTDNEIKNYWNTYMKREIRARGIDSRPSSSSSSLGTSGSGHSSVEDSASGWSLLPEAWPPQLDSNIDLDLSIGPPQLESDSTEERSTSRKH